jgi:hypothetical protein
LTPADLILGHGMLAAGRWRLGEKEAALAEALKVSQIISDTNQICHYVLPAYSALFEVYSGALAEESQPAKQKLIAKNLKAIRKSMWEFGVMYPVGRVQHALHEGQYHISRGGYRRAMKSWQKALKLAKRFRMPFLEGLVHAELARHIREDERQIEDHRHQAWDLLQSTSATYYLNRLNSVESQFVTSARSVRMF